MRGTSGRARAREQRSAHIEQVALELFRSRGFDRVTVEDVCAEAGVGPATFYRHFGTKEGVVFSYRETFAAALRASIEAAAGVPEQARLAAVLTRFAGFLESQSELLALRDEIVLGNERLLHRTLVVQREMEAELAEGLAGLRGVPPSDAAVRLEAGLGLLVLRTAVRSWRAGERDSLQAAVDDALGTTRGLLGAGPGAGAGDDHRT
ncbi:TetR/AcrR family transcriptional regulator [Blastococcus sp. SYSU D00922]